MGENTFPTELDKDKLPKHIGIIMDGNGRWAKKRHLPRVAGHRKGMKAVDKTVTACREIGIPALTLYAFSDENWGRPAREIKALMRLLGEFLLKETPRMVKEGIRFNTIGCLEDLPGYVQDTIKETKRKTRDNKDITLTLALSYGARREILDAARRLAGRAVNEKIDPGTFSKECFEAELSTAGLPELELLIRTSGEMRISNFLLYQLAYAELYFTNTLWPDFDEQALKEALLDFGKRERRFGLTGEQKK